MTISGPISTAVDALRTLVANLAIFQTITASGSAAAALPRIYTSEIGLPIVSVSASGSAVTITLSRIHQIQAGDVITIQGAALGAQSDVLLDGAHTVTQVGAYEVVFTSAAEAGTYTPDRAFVLPCPRPFAIVTEPGNDALKATTIGTGGASVLSGTLEILLEADVAGGSANDPAAAQLEMRNTAGEFLRQLIQTQGTGDYIVLNGVELASLEFITTQEQDNATLRYERWRALLRCTWGLDG